ncbi:carboxyl transferase domain-containing protein, partial [Arthrobacter sp. HMWF013]|uniref:carboxyl transferase domain-containing protein n=1 Tax=Arthrobacter sp. HMWF013 TaxID=2056849 RepID=UPI001C627325
ITRAIEEATQLNLPLLASPVSGGTRMQEGTAAFVQMARITAAVNAHKDARLPYLVYLRHPTTGGVFASWGSLGHINVAQPHALVGFLGPKVYKALHGNDFPAGVQQSENLYRNGIIDAVLDPRHLRTFLIRMLKVLQSKAGTPAPFASLPSPAIASTGDTDSWAAVTASRDPRRAGLRSFLRRAATDLVPLSSFAPGNSQVVSLSIATIAGQGTVVVGLDRRAAADGTPLGPQALREAQRGMRIASDLGLPLLAVIDTPGADLSVEAEEGGLGREIARSLSLLLALRVPTVTLLLGQGAGGGALALFPADRIIASSDSWLAPLPPEGASAIVHGSTDHAAEMARQQRVGAAAMLQDGLVDEVVSDSPGASSNIFFDNAARAVQQHLGAIAQIDPDMLIKERCQRYEVIGARELDTAQIVPSH